ncbi:hypothetical protein ACQ3I4_00545 [Zafaria sp. Z1313]|uniref:hypothetical protein n=1 Tax=Zafaria sp. Z1313 TaxID=3423202 RepID=UPI003D301BA7
MDSNGSLTVQVLDTRAYDQMRGPDGNVELTISGLAGGGIYDYSFTADPGSESTQRISGKDVRTVDLNGLRLAPLGGASTTGTDRATGATATNKACTATKLQEYSPRQVLVGTTYVQTSGVTADFQYSTGANSTVGVGVSLTGNAGTYSASGTSTLTSSSVIDFPTTGANTKKLHYTQFVFARFRENCGSILGTKMKVRAVRLAGGTYSPNASANLTGGKCVTYNGGKHTNQSSAAVTWSNGAKTAGIIGIDLSVRTGFSSAAKTVFDFKSVRRQFCGTADFPGGVPRTLYATT